MTTGPLMRDFVPAQVNARLNRFVLELQRAAGDPGPDPIHDLRVSIRRFSQVLRVFGPFFPPKVVRKIRRRLREVMSAAAAVRDRDIAMEFLDAAEVPAGAELRVWLETTRNAAEHDLVAAVRSLRGRGFPARWRRQLELRP